MVKKTRIIVVDTYAIIADLTGTITKRALDVIESIRLGETEGLLHYLIICELAYHWRKGRLPFISEEEFLEFIDLYFKVVDLDPHLALEASRVKIEGNIFLKKASDQRLRKRTLSLADATTIALALKYNAPVLTGDIDLSYVAERLGVEVIW
ncbi:MAG: PIN domain nuclease [Thermoprotei archaeon]|nr:MAG: PIN domain nuclease [Thermoprotei archaeon]